ncbi:hypothetical protein GCM10029976_031970 [Kribbella albertanoniae]|uniref:XRE family transcriptional regulator n=1 Tax=Kribbella albertanoniae TaxID=1266829 RepID=A0A4R4QGZ8_9ACTN|nr:helix-turn-helix transcriptional regulator [Kribbella albertanoniae]TDC34991.1 XRE family transcriptional regulator [Kribbella albertanoniae]
MGDRGRKPNKVLRNARGPLSQEVLAEKLNASIYRATGQVAEISSKVISDYERGWYQWPREPLRSAFCEVLGVRTPEELGFQNPRSGPRPSAPASVDLLALAGTRSASGPVECVRVPGGRSYFGADLSAHYTTANRQGSELFLVEPSEEMLAGLVRPDRRSLVVAVDRDRRSYVADGRRFMDRAGRGIGPQAVSAANVVDDLTLGVIWATTNADSSLLADDGHLERSQAYVTDQESRSVSRGDVEEVPLLNPVAGQWLGSQFCSRHILRNLDQLGEEPLFWTREQRGEEAAAWLLWSHKFDYLRRTSRRFTTLRRGFCIPESEVQASPGYERVLLLLAMALMEGFGIKVELSVEPEHAEVEGFVLAGQAVVANWLGSPGLWCVEASAPASRLVTYRELAGQVSGESSLPQTTPAGRLEALADHLQVPWGWFRRRCTELATVGVDDVCHPRSRLLSTRGLNTAISFVSYIDVLEGEDFARR